MKKKELSILIAGGLAATFMLNNVTAVKAEELNDKVVSTSTVDESNKNNNAESTESLTKSSGSEDKLATGVNEQDSLNTQTTGEAVIANQEETNSDCVYLSDIDYIASQSKAGYGKITKDTNINGATITLIVDGEGQEFKKGIGAHATSTVVYDLRNYKNKYSRFISYVGIDKSQSGRGNGVKFSIYTSNDDKEWTLAKDVGLLTSDGECAYVDIDISNANYLKLYADDNGGNGNDHAVYGDAKLVDKNYGGQPISSDILKQVSDYDQILRNNSIEENMTNNELTILRRDFVNKVGYDNLQRLAVQNENYKNAIEYLLEDETALRYFIAGGPVNLTGSYTAAVKFFSDIYAKYPDELKSGTDDDFYLRMAISIGLAYGKEDLSRFWVGTPKDRDSVKRYEIYKELISSGKMDEGGQTDGDGKWSSAQFKALPVPLMRWVMGNRMHDDEIMWLADYALEQKSKGNNYLSAYNYINYTTGYNYDNPKLYDPSNYNKYNEKYHFSNYFSDYGTKNQYRLWMVFEEGSVCGGLAKTYSNLANTFGRPASVVGQPGHAATITYAWNKQNNRYEYIIQNNIYGWAKSGNEYYERLLGWGNKNWSEWYSASYAVLATDAVNDYDNYIKATELNILADAYSDNSTKREAYLKALDYQKINVDSMEGLINTYKADSSTTSTDYFNLSKRIIDTYTYYPQAMVEFLNMIKDKVTTPNEVAELDLSENNALLSASNATPSESTCVLMTKQLAEKYLGNVNNELASFSFDGENAGKIVLNSKYDGSEIRVRYSLDGGTNWTETDNHVITLTPEQLASINSTNDIKVGLVGIDDIFTIDILDSKPITESTVYKNDLENLLIGDIDNLEFSLDGGNTWCDYVGGLENGIRFTGDKTVKLRYKAYGHYLQGNSVVYTFTEDTNTPEKTYVQLNNVKLEGYSTQQDDSDHAAPNFIDGNYNTGWHTKFNYTDPDKFYTVSFDKVRNITSLEYIASGGFNGMIKDADIYTSLDGENWVKSGSVKGLARDYTPKTINLDKPTECKYLKLVATQTYGNSNGEANMYLSGKMLNFFENTKEAYNPEAVIKYSTTDTTSDNVTATIILPEGCTIVGDSSHVFESNGTFEFEYLDADKVKHTIEAKVDWIKKDIQDTDNSQGENGSDNNGEAEKPGDSIGSGNNGETEKPGNSGDTDNNGGAGSNDNTGNSGDSNSGNSSSENSGNTNDSNNNPGSNNSGDNSGSESVEKPEDNNEAENNGTSSGNGESSDNNSSSEASSGGNSSSNGNSSGSGSNSSGGSGHHHSSGSSSGSGSNSSSNSGNDASNESNNTVNSENKDDLDNNNNAGIKDSGWSQGNNNSWSYYKDGKPVKNDWVQDNNKWYYMNDSGDMATGWVQSPYSSKWYYMDGSGAMTTGWVQDNNKWYYMNDSGDMATGWMQSPYSGKWYYMDGSGAMTTGWVQDNNKWYYMNESGDMATGWMQSPYSGKWYYLNQSGEMLTNTTVNGYVLGPSGEWIK